MPYTGELIDTHCHFNCIQNYPVEIFFSRWGIPKSLVMMLIEAIEYGKPIVDIIEKISKLLGENINLYDFVDDFNVNLKEAMRAVYEQMNDVGIDIAVPLLLDLAPASHSKYIELPFEMQINQVSEFSLNSRGKILPFIGFDPRRKNALKLIINALEKKGFLGVKMYPPLGYCPNPNDRTTNSKQTNKVIRGLYEYCQSNSIPITAHCSAGGIRGYNVTAKQAKAITSPSNWFDVLWEYPQLRINLAHFGGNDSFIKSFNDSKHISRWTPFIIKYMQEFENLFADISFLNGVVDDRSNAMNAIRECMSGFCVDRILFGTDSRMHNIFYGNERFIGNLTDDLGDFFCKILMSENPRSFLFGDGEIIPKRISDLYLPVQSSA